MKEKFVNGCTLFVTKNMNYDEKEKAKLKYGLESLYLSLTKLFIIALIAFILGIFKEFLIILILFNFLRFPGFGFHAGNSTICLIFSSFLFVCVPFIFSKINVDFNIILVLEFIASFILLLHAPADTVKRPLPNKKKRKIRKTAAVSIAIVYIVLSIIFKGYFAGMFCGALILEAIMVSPVTYKIFKQPYNNYLNFKKA